MILQKQLQHAMMQMHIPCQQTTLEKLINHLVILQKWNKVHNLTAIAGFEKMLTLHVLDSLAVNAHFQGDYCLDLGSGAGFPGIPLAIVNPERQFVLMDSIAKKVQFLQYVKNELNLSNVSVVQSRIEDYLDDKLFDSLVARAVGSVEWIYQVSQSVLGEMGRLYLMLGKEVVIPDNLQAAATTRKLQVPGLQATRNLLILKKI